LGRFVDLVEVDAASRTGVDDTRELLENVQYAPSKGRYKIYLIDEVHMFSNSSFNALLKTLEEPPPHVKFLLATTEPAKLPITVLSRCLQFNLKRLDNDQISQYLASLLEKEGVEFETQALELLARAADGSMRDALSLLDQALAYGAGRISLKDVRHMLGVIEQRHIIDLLDAVLERDADKLDGVLQGLFERSPDYGRALQDLALLLHEISLPDLRDWSSGTAHGPGRQNRFRSHRIAPVRFYLAGHGRKSAHSTRERFPGQFPANRGRLPGWPDWPTARVTKQEPGGCRTGSTGSAGGKDRHGRSLTRKASACGDCATRCDQRNS